MRDGIGTCRGAGSQVGEPGEKLRVSGRSVRSQTGGHPTEGIDVARLPFIGGERGRQSARIGEVQPSPATEWGRDASLREADQTGRPAGCCGPGIMELGGRGVAGCGPEVAERRLSFGRLNAARRLNMFDEKVPGVLDPAGLPERGGALVLQVSETRLAAVGEPVEFGCLAPIARISSSVRLGHEAATPTSPG